MLLKFLAYAVRWQLSTPILWLVVHGLGASLEATIVANAFGASIFFWIDRFLFRTKVPGIVWEVQSAGTCSDCGRSDRVRRLVLAPGGTEPNRYYDRRADPAPEYRCAECSEVKLNSLRAGQRIDRSLVGFAP